jgi:hypothetical protein
MVNRCTKCNFWIAKNNSSKKESHICTVRHCGKCDLWKNDTTLMWNELSGESMYICVECLYDQDMATHVFLAVAIYAFIAMVVIVCSVLLITQPE